MEHLWAGWRSAYVQGGDAHGGDDERSVPDIADGKTLFHFRRLFIVAAK